VEPWYRVASPRTDLREGRSFNPDEFAIALHPGVVSTLLGPLPRKVAVLLEGSLRRWRRLKRLEELPRHDQMAVLKMIDALAERSAKRKGG
jgi:hypothetical protein